MLIFLQDILVIFHQSRFVQSGYSDTLLAAAKGKFILRMADTKKHFQQLFCTDFPPSCILGKSYVFKKKYIFEVDFFI